MNDFGLNMAMILAKKLSESIVLSTTTIKVFGESLCGIKKTHKDSQLTPSHNNHFTGSSLANYVSLIKFCPNNKFPKPTKKPENAKEYIKQQKAKSAKQRHRVIKNKNDW